jgi:protein-tyrosine-phosphatase
MADRPYTVLFLCTGNSARSLMAEAILNAEGTGRFRAFSAGSRPKGAPHPYTLDLLRRLNHDTSGLRSKDRSEFEGGAAPSMDFVFTVCDRAAAETCPVWPGQPMTAHWGVPDPVAVTGGEAERRVAFSDAYKTLARRIHLFASLPLDAIDRLALKRRLDDIGRAGAAEPAD